jgi:sortase A
MPNQPLQLLSRSLIVAGIGLLAIWGAFEFHRGAGGALAVSAWADEKAAATAALPVESQPDFALWSQKRIRAYKSAIVKQLSPTEALLRIPRLGIEVPVFAGTSEWSLNRGAGHIEGSAALGSDGNAGIASHRDGFFRGLKDIRIEDEVVLELRSGQRTYLVDEVRIVYPEQVEVLSERAAPSLTLVTCYPFYFHGDAPQRFIVKASLKGAGIDVSPEGTNPSSATP